MYLRTTAALTRLCDQANAEGFVAVDVEFIREYTYKPQLALIQIAVGDTHAIVDPLEIDDLSPLIALVNSPDVLKVFHAPAQDLEVLYCHTGVQPIHLFDTQTAAAILGLGDQLSYSRLVETLLGISLAKSETYTNWLQRPLTPEQVAYALDDVRYLHALHQRLTARLEEMQRAVWAVEEFRKFENLALYQRDPRTLYRRIRRGRSLSSRGQAILRELAAWREHEALERDRPPGSVLRDEILVDIARKAPQKVDDLRQLRGVPPREIERSGASLVAVVERGQAVPDADCPPPIRRARLSRTEDLMVKFLDMYLKILCQRKQLTPSCIASRTDLEQLVRHYRQGRLHTKSSPLLEGWRRTLVGLDLLAVLEGRVSLHLHPETGETVTTPRDP